MSPERQTQESCLIQVHHAAPPSGTSNILSLIHHGVRTKSMGVGKELWGLEKGSVSVLQSVCSKNRFPTELIIFSLGISLGLNIIQIHRLRALISSLTWISYCLPLRLWAVKLSTFGLSSASSIALGSSLIQVTTTFHQDYGPSTGILVSLSSVL